MGKLRRLTWAVAGLTGVVALVHIGMAQTLPMPEPSPTTAATTQPGSGQAAPADVGGEEMVNISFPENMEVRVLIEWVSDRVGINIVYDEVIQNQRVTIRTSTPIPKNSLMGLLQSVIQMKGCALVDMPGQSGWKRIVPAAQMPTTASPTTQPFKVEEGQIPSVACQVFQLQYIDVMRADQILKPFLTQPGGNSSGIPEQRMLIVTDYASNMKRISDLVKFVDQPKQDVAVEFIKLINAEAGELSPRVLQILNAKFIRQGAPGTTPGAAVVDVGFDARTNTLVVIGSRAYVAEAKEIIAKLDMSSGLQTRTYRFEALSPERVDNLIKQMLEPATAKRVYQSAVDKDARMLVATATPEWHERIETLQKELTAAMATEEMPIKFYKLSNATAADVLDTIRGIAGEEGGGAAMSTEQLEGEGTQRGRRSPMGQGRRTDLPIGQLLQTPTGSSTTQPSLPLLGYGTPSGREGEMGSGTAGRTRTSAVAQTLQTKDAIVTADPNTNTIIVVGPPAVQKFYETLIKTLDKRRPQVLIECTIVTLNTSKNFALAVDIGMQGGWGGSDIITFGSFGVSQEAVAGTDSETAAPTSPTGRRVLKPGLAGFNGALISSDIADILINALVTNGRSRVVSAPRILVNDNATGTLSALVGQPYASLNVANTVSTTSFGGYVNAGTTIDVTPHISEADYLQLEYSVSLDSFTGTGQPGIPPPLQTNSLRSSVTIPDGSTIIVGGLSRTNYSKQVSAVPILGEIPILEYLFSSRTQDESETTAFVFIRPVILRDDQFEDLKYLSERDVKGAQLPADMPSSEPVVMQ